jgi:Mrp family chromosome partitioning ATPase
MSNGIAKKTNALIKQDIFNPLVRFTSDKREGRQLLKNLKKNIDNPEAAFAIQGLRDQIFFAAAKGGKTIGFAGPRGEEGVTSTSILLGLTLGDLKRNRVVFIDGRMDRRNFAIFSEMFGLVPNAMTYNNGCGLFQCFNTKNRNFCFLTPGASLESLEVFSNSEFVHLVGELREAFDYVVFDLPPLLSSSETRMALPHLDLFFLVCTARKSTFDDIEKCKKMAASVGRTISGVILNRQRAPFWTALFGRDAFY